MAREPSRLGSILLVLLSLLHFNFSADLTSSNHLLLPHTRSSMVLPLFLSSPNSSRSLSDSRRHLQRSDPPTAPHASARMRLFDDLLLNGYYTTRLWIGTPPQKFSLIVDTGSTVTYVPCSTCEQCGIHEDPKFEPELSSTYRPMKCNPDCNCDEDLVQCIYERQYAEMSTSTGVLGEDIISFGNLSELVPQHTVFGCEKAETGDLYSQHADGIMGLGRGNLSIVDQLVDKGVIGDSFSLCYGGMDIGGGAMILGAISPPSDMVFTYSDPVRSPYYNIDLKEMHVAGKKLSLDPMVFDAKHGTVLDSGTTYAYLPEPVFVAFKDAIMNELHSLTMIRGTDPNYNDICFSAPGSNSSNISITYPVVDMVFESGQKLSLSPENYLFRHSKVDGAYCLGIFQNGNDPTTLIGGIVVRNTLVTYDRKNSKVGFWKTNCSELWERLGKYAGPPPQIAPSQIGPPQIAPTLAPNGPPPPPHYELPGDGEIQKLTFELLLNISYTVMKPSTAALLGSIARELNINTSQVVLLNINAVGNDSLVKLAILSEDSSEYISHSNALAIVSKLSEHRMDLPPSFGSYKLLRWNAEPRSKRRKQGKRHYSMGVIASIATLIIIGLSASGIWYVRRCRQQSLSSYKPVHMAVPEQELQPL